MGQDLGRLLLLATPVRSYLTPPDTSPALSNRDVFIPHTPVEEATLSFLLQSSSTQDASEYDASVFADLVLTYTSSAAQCPQAIVPVWKSEASAAMQVL